MPESGEFSGGKTYSEAVVFAFHGGVRDEADQYVFSV
jgi:hypothetical protein